MRDFKMQPARDLGLSPHERSRSVRREVGLRGLLVCHLWQGFAKVYLKLWHRLSVEGREHLPSQPPYIVIANHCSHLDALVLASALPAKDRRRVFPVAAGDTFFETRVLTAFATWCMNALPMWRKRAGRHAVGELRERCAEGEDVLILFPEGTRGESCEMTKFRPGIGMLAAGSAVPVVPCFIEGAFDTWPKGSRFPRPGKVTLRVGKAMVFNDVPNDRKGWDAVASHLEEAVKALGGLAD